MPAYLRSNIGAPPLPPIRRCSRREGGSPRAYRQCRSANPRPREPCISSPLGTIVVCCFSSVTQSAAEAEKREGLGASRTKGYRTTGWRRRGSKGRRERENAVGECRCWEREGGEREMSYATMVRERAAARLLVVEGWRGKRLLPQTFVQSLSHWLATLFEHHHESTDDVGVGIFCRFCDFFLQGAS